MKKAFKNTIYNGIKNTKNINVNVIKDVQKTIRQHQV